MYRSNNMKKPGIIDSRFQWYPRTMLQRLPSIMSVTSATSGALADGEQGDAAAASSAMGHTVRCDGRTGVGGGSSRGTGLVTGSGCRNLNGGGLGAGYSANSLDRDGLGQPGWP